MSNIIQDLSKNIGRILRYIFPGLVVLGTAGIAYPWWFEWLDISDGYHLLFLLVVATIVGNTWYVFHRYGIHQIIDYFMFAVGSKGPSGKKGHRGPRSYISELSEHVVLTFRTNPEQPIREHVSLRASQMHLMYIASEALFIFSWFHTKKSFFTQNSSPIRIVAVVLFGFTVIQNLITRRIDWLSIQKDYNSQSS